MSHDTPSHRCPCGYSWPECIPIEDKCKLKSPMIERGSFAASETAQRDAALEEALRNFLVLRTDAPNFVAFFTSACFCAEHALKGNVDPNSGGGGADVTSIVASQTGHVGSAGNGGSLYFPSNAAIIRYSFDKNGKPYTLDQREADRPEKN